MLECLIMILNTHTEIYEFVLIIFSLQAKDIIYQYKYNRT